MRNKGSVMPGLAVAAATAVGVLRVLPGPSARTAHPLWSEHAPVSDRDCAAMSFAQKVTSLGFNRSTASRFFFFLARILWRERSAKRRVPARHLRPVWALLFQKLLPQDLEKTHSRDPGIKSDLCTPLCKIKIVIEKELSK